MKVLSLRILRMTWAAITANPNASAREIAAQLDTGYQYGDIAAALQQLVMAGYIGDRPDRCAPRPIFLPFSADIELLRGPNPRHKIQEPRTEKARR